VDIFEESKKLSESSHSNIQVVGPIDAETDFPSEE